MNISIPARVEKPPIKETLKSTNPSTIRKPTQTEERANQECPVKEIRDHTTEPHRIPTIDHPTKMSNKAKHQEAQKQTKRVS